MGCRGDSFQTFNDSDIIAEFASCLTSFVVLCPWVRVIYASVTNYSARVSTELDTCFPFAYTV